jgi:pyridoxal phosphate enzyme (YggS family)
MTRVAANLQTVQDRIAEACRRADRDPDSVRLLPVSKTHGPELIKEAYAAGARIFGENRVQEAKEKAEHFADRADLRWALIGHLQTNKAKDVAAFAAEFHALDSMKVARALDRHLHDLGRALDVFIQVNSSAEPQKFGLAPDEVEQFAYDVAELGTLRVRGLMTLAVFSDDQQAVRRCFEQMVELQRQLRESGAPGSYDELSMGMSGDFELAIEYGATTVRVGEAIFGARQPYA